MRRLFVSGFIFVAIIIFITSCNQNSNNNLKTLSISTGYLIPEFSPEVTQYSVSSLNCFKDIKIFATADNVNADILINETYAPGEPFKLISLSETGKIVIEVKAANSSIKKYYIDEMPQDIAVPEVLISNNPEPGYLFLSSFSFANLDSSDMPGHYNLIIDNSADVMYYGKLKKAAMDFNIFNDSLYSYNYVDSVFAGMTYGEIVLMNQNFEVVKTLSAKNGLTETHDFAVAENGNILLQSIGTRYLDLSESGGMAQALVTSCFIEEQDKDGNIVFSWDSKDFFQLGDVTPDVSLKSGFIPVVHPNSLEIMADGNILLSCRHLDEITKIDRKTGEIIWRMGGKHCKNNQFKFINDHKYGFSHQHSVSVLENGNLMLFDNGNLHGVTNPEPVNLFAKKVIIDNEKEETESLESRAVEYRIDEKNKTAELVWEYSINNFSEGMGSVQRIENGNIIIGWGKSHITLTEINSKGEKVLEMSLPEGFYTNHVYKNNSLN
ncbi:MAG: aryl-sulfate sulfotransferase [Bacteroidota bacterium]